MELLLDTQALRWWLAGDEALAGALPGLHRDPFDRMLVAPALQEGMTLVSNEAIFSQYGVARIW